MSKQNQLYEKYDRLLQDKGVTTYEVCKQTQIDVSTMSNWKHGNYVPKADKLLKIANYFNVDLNYFYE